MSSLLPLSNNRGTGGIRFKTLVQPGALISPLVLTRAQIPGVESTAVASDGSTVQTYGANAPRFSGTARRLLFEASRINIIPNPRAENSTPGVPGTPPPTWIPNGGLPTGLSREIIGQVTTVNGQPGLRVRYFGAATVTGNIQIGVNNTSTTASAGLAYTASVFARVVAGSLANITQIRLRTRTSGGGNDQLNVISMTGALQRFSHTLTANAGTTAIFTEILLTTAVGDIDVTFDVLAPQIEQGAFASTHILPPVASPGSSTRGADTSINTPLSTFGINTSGACTILLSAMYPFTSATTGATGLISISDGTNSNRLFVRSGGGNILVLNNTVGGVSATLVGTANAWTPGTVFRAGIVALGNGTIRVILNNGTIVSQAGGPTSGLTALRIGAEPNGGTPMFAEINTLKILPFALPDAALTAYVAALPV